MQQNQDQQPLEGANDQANVAQPGGVQEGVNMQAVLPGMAGNGEAMDEVQEDGYIMLNQNQASAGQEGNLDQAAQPKPQFGMAAHNIIGGNIESIQRTTSAQPVRGPQNFENHVVLMKGITWSRDSHGLFDYESRHLTKKTLKASHEAMIMRSGNELQLSRYNDQYSFQEQLASAKRTPDDMAMLKIVNLNNSTFYLESAAYQHHKNDLAHIQENGKQQESMYLVVRSLKINNEKIDYEIQERDILKIGRVKFAVKEIGYANQPMDVDSHAKEEKGHSANSVFTDTPEEEFEEFIKVPGTFRDMSAEDPEHKCRFCWATEATDENPLLGTCKCAGSMGQIHYNCLSGWLQSRQQSKLQANFSTYFWKAFECEICKTPYPLMMKAGVNNYNLVKYDKPQGDYMVLESLSQEKNTSRIIHIIRPSATKTVFKLGRGHESDLRINDISVSRCHTKIKFEKGKFLLEDNQSKFGTLVLVKQRTPLLPGFNKAVQVGRTVINFSVKGQGLTRVVAEQQQSTTELGAMAEDISGKQDFGAVGVVKTNTKTSGTAQQPAAESQHRVLNRRASEREMPSAEQQFQDQLGSMGGPQPQSHSQPPVANPVPPQQTLFSPEDYVNMNLPEDVQLQMALQISMQTANQGQAQGNLGDQDSINNGGNEGDD